MRSRVADARMGRMPPVGGRGLQALSGMPAGPQTLSHMSAVGAHTTSGLPPTRPRMRSPHVQHGVTPHSRGGGAPQGDTGSQVFAFLKQCGLHMYTAQLLQSGFDEMETLHVIEDADMQELGIPPVDASRLRRGLQELLRQDGGNGGAEAGIADGNPVFEFLQVHSLEQYFTTLLGSGFDEMETLLDVDDADLKDLGIPRGHALKLRRHLREYQAGPPAEEEQPAIGVAAPRISRPHVARAPLHEPAPRLDATDRMKGDVQRSWDMILHLGTARVGEHLYKVFFEMLPEAMDSFPLHVRIKYQDFHNSLCRPETEEELHNSAALANLFSKVINAIGCTVAGLQESDKLVPLLTTLGMRHISYRVREDFWPVLAKAMKITLRDLLGEAFTPEVENAWTIVYGFMSQIMIQGLRRAIELSQD